MLEGKKAVLYLHALYPFIYKMQDEATCHDVPWLFKQKENKLVAQEPFTLSGKYG